MALASAVVVAVLVGAVLQSATGFGFALVTAPILFAVFTPGEALTMLALLAGMLSLLVVFGERREVTVLWGDVVRLVGWGLPGLAVGVLVLRAVDKPVLQVAVGVAVVAAAVANRRIAAERESGAPPRPWPVAPVGLLAGVLTTTVAVNGPPMVLYFLRSGADPQRVRDSLAATFLLFAPFSVGALAAGGLLGFGDLGVLEIAGLMVVVLAGRPLGRALFLRLSARRFRALGLWLAVLAGVGSVVAGLAG